MLVISLLLQLLGCDARSQAGGAAATGEIGCEASGEVCNGVDDDCDGVVDEGDADGAGTWYRDADADGHGDSTVSTVSCSAPAQYVALADDCDDGDGSIAPGAADSTCDGVDGDCDGQMDEDAAYSDWFTDADGDGWGGDSGVWACAAPAGTSALTGDCDDADDSVHPGAEEADCTDPTDHNCDGSVAFEDIDEDGVPACEDCDDTSAGRYPGAAELCDGHDDDCDGSIDNNALDSTVWYEDADGDGWGSSTTEVECAAPVGFASTDGDCDDSSSAVSPSTPEIPYNGVDDDCDGADLMDVDGDGVDWLTDCADDDPSRAPGLVEVLDDGADQDCVDQAPTLGSVTVSPAAGDTTTSFACVAGGWSDGESSGGGVEIEWLAEGAVVATGSSLAPGVVARGQSVVCRGTPVDDVQSGVAVEAAPIVLGDASPTITADAAATVAEGDVLLLTFSVQDADADAITMAAAGLDGAVVGPTELEWSPGFDDAGSYVATLTATANGVSVTSTIAVTVTNTDRAPVVVLDCGSAAVVGEAYSCSAQASDPDGDSVRWSLAGAPTSMAISSTAGEVAFTPASGDGGLWEVEVVATSAGGATATVLLPLQVEDATSFLSGTMPATGALVLSGTPSEVDLTSVTLTIPSGALPPGTVVTVDEVVGSRYSMPGSAGLSFEAGAELASPAAVAVGYSDTYLESLGLSDADGVAWAYLDEDTGRWSEVDTVSVDGATRVLTASMEHFSFRTFTSGLVVRAGFVDPVVTDSAGAEPVEDYFEVGAANCLVVHGILSEAASMYADGDNIGSYAESRCDAVLYYEYGWAWPIDYNGAAMARTLAPYVGDAEFVVLAHSAGGLVTRSMLQLHGFDAVAEQVSALITFGTPHEGGDPTAPLEGLVNPAGLLSEFLSYAAPGVYDLLESTLADSGSFLSELGSVSDEGSFGRYCVAANDPLQLYYGVSSVDTDGVVPLTSALAMCTSTSIGGVEVEQLQVEFDYSSSLDFGDYLGLVYQAHSDIAGEVVSGTGADEVPAPAIDTWGLFPRASDDDADGTSEVGGDCDDTDAGINPGAVELCASGDEDCDASTTDADGADTTTWYVDVDGDRLGDAASTVDACSEPDGYVDNADDLDDLDGDNDGERGAAYGGTDCDDGDPTAATAGTEGVDGVDNDCDGLVDETESWHWEAVETSGSTGQFAAMALDGSDVPHVAYEDDSDYLVYATDGTFGWSTTTLNSSSTLALHDIRVEIDGSGDIVLGYTDSYSDDLLLRVGSSSWSSTTLDSATHSSTHYTYGDGELAMCADDAGVVHLFYSDGPTESIRYGRSDASYTFSTASTSDPTAMACAADPSGGGVGLAVLDDDSDSIEFVYVTSGGSFSRSTVDASGDIRYAVDVAFDSSGTPYVFYYDEDSSTLQLGTYASSSWTTSSVDTISGWWIHDIEVEIDADDGFHVAYTEEYLYNYTATYLYSADGSSWGSEAIGQSGDSPESISMTLDSLGFPHLVYYDESARDVVYGYYF